MRETYWDAAKGIAIIAVAMIHSTGYLLQSGSIYDDIGLVLRQVLNFAVPTFLFIAGYFSFSKKVTSNFEYLKSRILRILPPYIFWSIIFFLISIIIFGQPLKILNLIYGLLFGTSIGIGYFVLVLIQFTIITIIIKNIENKKIHISLIALFSLVGFLYSYLTKFFIPGHILSTFPYSVLPFFVWYPFYHFGWYLSKYKPNIELKNKFSVLTVLFLLAIVEGYILKDMVNIEFGASQVKVSSFLLSLFICMIIYQNKGKQNVSKFLIFLGLNSYGIYLIHILFIGFFNKFLSFIWMGENLKILGILILPTLSMIFSIITIQIIRLILRSKSKYVVG